MTQIHWAELPLRRETQRMAAIIDPMYAAALEKNWTPQFHEELKIISKSRMNLIMSWFGLQGSGKSLSLLDTVFRFLGYSGKRLNIKNCFFTLSDLLRAIAVIKQNETVILDEQIHSTGYGSATERHALENIEMTVRAHRLSLFFSAPKFIQHSFHYFMETWQMGSLSQWDWDVPIEKQWKYTKNIIHSHKGHQIGYVITGAPDDKDFLDQYEKKKDLFITEVKQQKGSLRFKFVFEMSESLLHNPGFLKEYTQKAKTKRLKELLCTRELGGVMLTTEEWRKMVDYIDAEIAFNESYKKFRPADPKK